MFCPECGTLGFMEGNGNIRCTNYTCGYEGPLAGKDGKGAEFTDPMTGETINLAEARTTVEVKERDDRTRGEDKARGILYEDSYILSLIHI